MARSRKISTDISIEAKLNRVSEFAALLYTWAIPHAKDDCRLPKRDPEELRLLIFPGRNRTAEDMAAALDELLAARLMGVDDEGRYFFPSEVFYKHQSYIGVKNRSETPNLNEINSAEIAEKCGDSRKVRKPQESAEIAENGASPSLSLSPSSDLKAGRPEAPAFLKTKLADALATEPPKAWHERFAKLYRSDPRRFALLFGWCKAAENKGYAEARVADALAEFERYDAKGPVDSWARYLDTLIDRRTVRANAREFEAVHEAEKQAEAGFVKSGAVPLGLRSLISGIG